METFTRTDSFSNAKYSFFFTSHCQKQKNNYTQVNINSTRYCQTSGFRVRQSSFALFLHG